MLNSLAIWPNKNVANLESARFILGRWLSILLAILLIVVLLSVSFFAMRIIPPTVDAVTIREISVAALPPPPPPPLSKSLLQEEIQAPALDLGIEGGGTVMKFSQLPVTVDIRLDDLYQSQFADYAPDWDRSLQVEWSDIGLGDIDEVPYLLRRSSPSIPVALRKRGINNVKVVLHIMIDQTGEVYLKEVIENPYPEMDAIIRSFVQSALFTKPKINGVPVNAMYTWRVEFRG